MNVACFILSLEILRATRAPFLVFALHAQSLRFALGASGGLWPRHGMAHSLRNVYVKIQLSK